MWAGRCPVACGVRSRCDCTPLQGFSAFFYTMDFLRTVMGLPVATLQQLEAAVATVCNQTWSEVRPPPRSSRAAPEGPASQHQASLTKIWRREGIAKALW